MRGVLLSLLAAGASLSVACAPPLKRATYIVAVPGKPVMICRLEPRTGSHNEHRVCRPPNQLREQRADLVLNSNRRRGSI